MSEPERFDQLLIRLRAGDEDAVRHFVATYEPYLRRTLRRRLARTPYQAAADSGDLCQSVLASFMVRCVAGDFELDSPEDLVKLLTGMARKKLAHLMRHESAERRDRLRTQSLEGDPQVADGRLAEPSQILVGKELLSAICQRLSPADRALFEQRQQGKSWEEIAALSNENAAVLRKRLSRALKNVSIELGLEASDE